MIWAIASKIVIAIALAMVAECCLRRRSQPSLAFAAWYSVLLVLLLPPLFTIPVLNQSVRGDDQTTASVVPAVKQLASERPTQNDSDSIRSIDISSDAGDTAFGDSSAPQDSIAATPLSSSESTTNDSSVSTAPAEPLLGLLSFTYLLIAIWIAGSIYLLARRVLELRTIAALMKRTEPAANKFQAEYQLAAQQMGIQRAPKLVVADGSFSPMLWQPLLRQAKIVVPVFLTKSLKGEALDSIYRHELSHFRRRDGLRRWLEIVATSVWWWFPIAWLAQKRLHQLEEVCTDADVIRTSPSLAKTYARTLLDAEAYSSCPANRLVPTFSTTHPLKARIESIVGGIYRPQSRLAKLLPAAMFAAILPAGLLSGTSYQANQESSEAGAAKTEIKVAWTKELNSPSFGAAAVADIDDDGRLEIAFGTYFEDDSVRVLNGEDGSEYWRYNAASACLDASLRFADLDRDGALELVVPVSNRGWVLAFDAKTGDEKWRYSTTPTECTDTPPAILDFDGDGDLEVLYGTFQGNLHVMSNEGKRESLFSPTDNYVQTGPLAKDLNGDGTLDLGNRSRHLGEEAWRLVAIELCVD